MRKRVHRFGVAAAASMAAIGMTLALQTPAALASTHYPLSQKQIVFGGKLISQPMGIAAIDPSSGQNTTYMPIWYVMQALKSVGIQSGWDGTNWTMTMPSNMPPKADLKSLTPGKGGKQIYINNVDVQNVNGIVYPDPASHVDTTYIPIWYVMKVLGYENVQSGWNGSKWDMTPTTSSSTGTSSGASGSTASPAASGIVQGITKTGDLTENWQENGQDVTLDNLPYSSNGNTIPLQGKVNSSDHSDVVVEVYNSDSENWFYSVPVDSQGQFSVTITLPYGGTDCVSVGIPEKTDTSFGLGNTASYDNVQNNQPTLPESQMALLQSWMVNYNESGDFQSLANTITASAGSKDAAIKAVSDWVSKNTEYNFPEVNQNHIAWQQATDTMANKVGVCQDQAALAASLLRSIGVPTEVIGGEAYYNDGTDAGPHAWNMAWDGTRWVTFDSTWDQNYTEAETNSIQLPDSISDDYFDPQASSFSQTHRPDANQPFGWMYAKR